MTWKRVRSAVHGHEHAKARKVLAARHDPSDPCVRCGHRLGPMGPHLHLDHHDRDKRVYLGFSHGAPCPVCRVACNIAAAGALGRARQRQKAAPRRPVRHLRW